MDLHVIHQLPTEQPGSRCQGRTGTQRMICISTSAGKDVRLKLLRRRLLLSI
jgi:hypothetical protein